MFAKPIDGTPSGNRGRDVTGEGQGSTRRDGGEPTPDFPRRNLQGSPQSSPLGHTTGKKICPRGSHYSATHNFRNEVANRLTKKPTHFPTLRR